MSREKTSLGISGEPSPRLEVRLLGGAEVVLDGERLRPFDAPRLHRFLALIALERGPKPRARLAFELWPDSDERQARTNLRKLIHDFRNALPEVDAFVEIGKEVVRWRDDAVSRIDALRFRDAVARGDLELAARLYTGDLLPACYDDLVLDERAKLRTEARGVLTRLAEAAAAQDDHERTIRSAQRLLELEPTDEAAARLQMEAHLALDDRAAALRVYHRHAEVLERELGVAPDDRVEGLYRRLQRAGKQRDVARGAESPFVGREVEWVQLLDAWSRTVTRGAHLALITGEPGIGKSRLALEFGRQVRSEGHVVASARAYEAAGRLPWGPVVDLLRSEAVRGDVEALEPAWRGELSRLLPELADEAASLPPSPTGDVTRRQRLLDAASRALVGTRPRLLIVDDLQWCDTETIELIAYVVRTGRTAPVLIVGTVRAEEVPADHPLVGLAEALARDHAVTTVALDRLDEATTATLAARLRAEDRVDPELARRIWAETEGNPLFVVETLRAGVPSESGQAVLTPTMRAVLAARLAQLSDGARRVAEVAAVVGRPFSVALLATVAELDEAGVIEAVDELWARRIIRDAGHRYDFSHDKLRSVALERVGPARRRQLHRAVAEAVASEHRDGLDALSAQLAAHYDQAGMVESAVEAYRAAGERAASVSAPEEALAMFQRALTLLADLPPSAKRDALELDLRIALGSPLVALEGYGSSRSHRLYERALSLCRKLRRPVDPPILRGLGLARLQGCRFADCDDMARALVEHERADAVVRTEGRYLLGVSAFWQGHVASARNHLEGAIASYDPARREEHLASYAQDPKAVCLVRLALAQLWAGDAPRADATVRDALALADELEHLMTSAYVLTYAAIYAAEADDLDGLADRLERADRLWARLSERYLVVVLDALRGWLRLCRGSGGGIERIVEAVTRSRAAGETLHLTYTLLLLARARGVAGEYAEGRAAIREALAFTDRSDQRYLEAELWRVDGDLAFRRGAREAAQASLRRAFEVARAQGADRLARRAQDTLARSVSEPGEGT